MKLVLDTHAFIWWDSDPAQLPAVAVAALRDPAQAAARFGVLGKSEEGLMSAVLRAYGADFAVDSFLADCTLPVCAVKRRGEPVGPASQPNNRCHDRSGVHVLVSEADFDEFVRQVAEATAFLQAYVEEVRRLCEFPGVEDVTLDFGIARRDVFVQCDHLPPEFVRVAGSLGLGIELTQYPIDETPSIPEGEAASDR
jgi:hypothetical protein